MMIRYSAALLSFLTALTGCRHNVVIVTLEVGKVIPERVSALEYCKAMAKANQPEIAKFCAMVLEGATK